MIEGSGKMLILAVGLHSQTGRIYRMLGLVKEQKKAREKQKKTAENNGEVATFYGSVGVTDLSVNSNKEEGVSFSNEDLTIQSRDSQDIERKQTNHSVFQEKLNVMAYRIGLLGTTLHTIELKTILSFKSINIIFCRFHLRFDDVGHHHCPFLR